MRGSVGVGDVCTQRGLPFGSRGAGAGAIGGWRSAWMVARPWVSRSSLEASQPPSPPLPLGTAPRLLSRLLRALASAVARALAARKASKASSVPTKRSRGEGGDGTSRTRGVGARSTYLLSARARGRVRARGGPG